MICQECEGRLHSAYELKILAEESDRKFNNEELTITVIEDELEEKGDNVDPFADTKEDVAKNDLQMEKDDVLMEGKDEEIDAVSFVLKYIPETIAELHKRTDSGRGTRKPVDYKDRKHECTVCTKRFLRRSNLIDHLRLHANQRPFECEYCNKTFVQSGNYKSHLRIHTKERPYECKVCLKSYNQPSALKVHIRTHTMEKNYVCPICNKRFTNSSDLSKHKRIHDEVKKYTCNFCSKDFAQNVNLKKHIRNNHREAIEVSTSKKNTAKGMEIIQVIV